MTRTLRLAAATVLTAVAVCGVVAAPAHAHRPDVNRSACVVAGGEYAQVGGTRTCLTKTTTSQLGPVITATASETRPRCSYHRSCAGDLVEYTFTGTSQAVTNLQTVNVRRQHGNDQVVTTTTTAVLDTAVVPLTCSVEPNLSPSYGPLTNGACAERGLFTA